VSHPEKTLVICRRKSKPCTMKRETVSLRRAIPHQY
jgi:hypothetical protein